MKKLLLCFSVVFVLWSSGMTGSAAGKTADDFYDALSTNEDVYKEYKNASINIRKLTKGSELDEITKELVKYFGTEVSVDSPKEDIYFFASIYEDKFMIVHKYAIYDLKGKLLQAGYGRHAKKDAVLKGEFNGWEKPIGSEELANENPTAN